MRIGTGWERADGGSSATLGLGDGEVLPAVADVEGDGDTGEDVDGDGEELGPPVERRPTVK
jgi:hypothetical protein